jgi:hypothetical protein
MPGNEKETIKFILENKKNINLKYIGKIKSIQVPYKDKKIEVTSENLENFYSDDSSKKADIYLNDKGISLKQEGGNFAFNRLQRKYLPDLLENILKIKDSAKIINKIDNKIENFHNQKNNAENERNFSPSDVMTKEQFNAVLKYLMLEGSPKKRSKFTAEFILVSKNKISSPNDLKIFNFEEYLNENSLVHNFARRRSWYGQSSDTEHKRAKGLLKAKNNKQWCFSDVSGLPNLHEKTNKRWREEIPEAERKTCYYLMIETKKSET